ncbi:efflux RND transporter periplasmic adaptor subunit [Hyphobacterium sp.]|uniref:efflux RND transporter periplasmic adaptor subunit n=1 Tax=Hyphobacterium sp. TaxID=2004662 RepID=UPI003B52514D
MLTALASALLQVSATATFTVEAETVIDEKAVFATVESVDVVSARARIGGVIGELRVDEGDLVAAGDIIAVVVDDRLAPQIGAANSTTAALNAQLEQAQSDLARAQNLFDRGIFAQARLDEAQTAVDVLENQIASARQERAVLVQQSREGDVLAPTAGRILEVPVTAGSVVLPGESIAAVASDLFVLRLMLPERHARSISEGDAIRVDGSALTGNVAPTGFIRQVYPRIEDGRVIADAVVDGLGDYFVGERVRVLVGVEQRLAYRIPIAFLETRYGVDYVRVREGENGTQDVVVQIGEADGDMIEILAGLAAGDVLVRP